jgi:hypothetical protein
MAGIRWGRGFFRLWVLFSGLWAIGAAAIGVGVASNPYVSTKAAAIPSDVGEMQLFDMYGEPYNSWAAAARAGELKETVIIDRYVLFSPNDTPNEKLADRIIQAKRMVDAYIADEKGKRRSEALINTAFWAVVPPLVVLVLCWAIGWAISGFRRSVA